MLSGRHHWKRLASCPFQSDQLDPVEQPNKVSESETYKYFTFVFFVHASVSSFKAQEK